MSFVLTSALGLWHWPGSCDSEKSLTPQLDPIFFNLHSFCQMSSTPEVGTLIIAYPVPIWETDIFFMYGRFRITCAFQDLGREASWVSEWLPVQSGYLCWLERIQDCSCCRVLWRDSSNDFLEEASDFSNHICHLCRMFVHFRYPLLPGLSKDCLHSSATQRTCSRPSGRRAERGSLFSQEKEGWK